MASLFVSHVYAENDIRILRFRELTHSVSSEKTTPPAQQSPPALQSTPAAQEPAAQQPLASQPAATQQVQPQSASPQVAAAPTQPTAFPRAGARPPLITQPLIEPQVTSQTRQALAFYGGYSARATLNQLPRRARLQPGAATSLRRHAKPFETIHHDPTVTPYLNLFREEERVESAPNYFAFVRPQMEQLDANRLQQREIQQLRGQLHSMSSTVAAPRYQASGMPGTGTPARYMDTAQFYGSR